MDLRSQFLLKSSIIVAALIEVMKLVGRWAGLLDSHRPFDRGRGLLGAACFVSSQYFGHCIGTQGFPVAEDLIGVFKTWCMRCV